MDDNSTESALGLLLADIDLPERAYAAAERRYEDLGAWFSRDASGLAGYDAHVFVQGSFALGTAIKPVNPTEEYDLDFTCKLKQGADRTSHSQRAVKALVGEELRGYRVARQIVEPLESKNRCWRLSYRDEMPFHMDVVPGIRADDGLRSALTEAMRTRGLPTELAMDIARRALWITEEERPNFAYVSSDWPSSNPGGYQLWFASRQEPTTSRILAEAQIDPMPVFGRRTPLQQTVQLLKRHRDVYFVETPDVKPVSIILTTLAGQAYVPGESVAQTVQRTLDALNVLRRTNVDEIFNPINPHENFADRWTKADCIHLQLKRHFHEWINVATQDFGFLRSAGGARLVELAEDSFRASVPYEAASQVTASPTPTSAAVRRVEISAAPPSPWCV
jgi:hypothetical protein